MLSIARYALVPVFLFLLYFHGLDAVGLLGPDEPRYAWIGREMARSGDWVTPRLWGEAWFEKPVLIYWMTAAGFRLRLSEELAPRLPLALLSVLFLVSYGLLLKEEFGARAAATSTVLLGTSAGWLAYSHVAVTDLPLSAAFALAMLAACRWLRTGDPTRLWITGALLGAAVLAKGLVPLVLAAPLAWMGRRKWRDWWRIAAPLAAVASPWYLLCYAGNGAPFLDEFLWKHHFGRFFTRSLEHVQPAWFFLPVILAGLFPWTPLVGLLRPPGPDPAPRFLWASLLFGFAFFSASVNKLPGYVLPLLPILCALLGVELARRRAPVWLASCAFLITFVPMIAGVLPQALESGIRRVAREAAVPWTLPLMPALAAAVWWLERTGRREWSVAVMVTAITAGVWLLQKDAYPRLDQSVSARSQWLNAGAPPGEVCLDDPHRARRYGLNYYAHSVLPDCETNPRPVRIR